MGNDEQKFSLKGQINKRKTQEMLRAIEDQRIARVNCEPTLKALVGDKRQTSETQSVQSDPRRTTGTMKSPPTITSAAVKTQQAARVSQMIAITYPAPKRFLRIWLALGAAAVALLILIVSVSTLFMMSNAPSPTKSAVIPLPVLSAADVINQLKSRGVSVVSSHEFAVPSSIWKANQEFQINVTNQGNNGVFIILSYPSKAYTIPDIIRARNSATFKEWQLTTGSNTTATHLNGDDTLRESREGGEWGRRQKSK